MKKKSRLRVSIGLLTVAAVLSLLALVEFVSANPSHGPQSNKRQTLAHVTPDGITIENVPADDGQSVATPLRRRAVVGNNAKTPRHSEAATTFAPEHLSLQPLGNTLWLVDDENAIADGVAIDANDVWGAWTLQGARLSAYPIGGNGTPDFEFSSFGEGSSGVASAKGADRMAYLESNAAGNDFRIHGFRSTSNGTPDWSFPFPETDPNLPATNTFPSPEIR